MTPDNRTLSAATAPPDWGELLGAGRSGVVYKSTDARGQSVARKIFESGPLTKIVQYMFLGSANPYAWNENAVEAAVLRRRILHPLVQFWFGDELRVARAWGKQWNEHYRAFQIDTEFVDGDAPRLRQPLSSEGALEVDTLAHELLPRLQARLEQAGFFGSVWQAGRGNPVAFSNFLIERRAEGNRWAWIDLESGVPALFPAAPMALVRYYLPACFKFGRPLFDDVDTQLLAAYVEQNASSLEAQLGDSIVTAMRRDVQQLSVAQNAWKSLSRVEGSVTSQLMKGRISAQDAEHFRVRPLRWKKHEALRLSRMALRYLGRARRKLLAVLLAFPFWRLCLKGARFLSSQTYRARLARKFVGSRIQSWQRRGQLQPADANTLRAALANQEASAYLTDFGVHLAIKPVVKGIEYFIFPALFAWGLVDETTLGIALLTGGALARTVYTLGRLVQASVRRHELPWVALAIGVLPIIGNLAYPMQLVYSCTEDDDYLAQFILYDGCSVLGRKIPIWGGRDTLTEHVFNRLADFVVRAKAKKS